MDFPEEGVLRSKMIANPDGSNVSYMKQQQSLKKEI